MDKVARVPARKKGLRAAGREAKEVPATARVTLSWHDLPNDIQERMYESFYPRERRLFRRLSKACRQQACHRMIKHLRFLAPCMAFNSLRAANQTLADRFSNLHTLNLVNAIYEGDLSLLGCFGALVCLKCSIACRFTEASAAPLAKQFPNLQALDMSCIFGALDMALHAFSALSRLTALAMKAEDKYHKYGLPFKLLENMPAGLSTLQSLAISQLNGFNSNSSCAFVAHLTQLTRLVLRASCSEAEPKDVSLATFWAPLDQLGNLRHLELPFADGNHLGWLRPLTKLTHLSLPGASVNCQKITADDSPLLPQLERLICGQLCPAAGQGQLLPSCTDLELTNVSSAQVVTSALQQCRAVQRLTLNLHNGQQLEYFEHRYAAQELAGIKQAASAIPSVHIRFCTLCAVNIQQFKCWNTLRAASVTAVESLADINADLVQALSQVTSLQVSVTSAEQADVINVCMGLPLLQEFTLSSRSCCDTPFCSRPAECAQLLASCPLATRQLLITITHLPAVQVFELNRELQDVGCLGIRFRSSDGLESRQ